MTAPAHWPDHVRAAVLSHRRPERDLQRDALRQPADTLIFFEVAPGQHLGEINAGWGYFSGLLAEAVGAHGCVHAHTTEASIRRWGGTNPLDKRITRQGLANLRTLVGPMENPGFPPGLDAIFSVMCYHDAVWSGVDRTAMNRALFAALKPGGILGIIDHHARPGRGAEDCHAIHRVERQLVIDEVTAAGFVLEAESDLLANPEDPCTEDVHPKAIRDRTHRFMLKFRRPG